MDFLNLTDGMDGGNLSNKRPSNDDKLVVRTTPTRGNITAMEPAARVIGLNNGSRAVLTKLPTQLAGGQVPVEYGVDPSIEGDYLAIHKGDIELGVGNKCARQGKGYQFSSANAWLAMGGEEDIRMEYEIAEEGFVAIGIFGNGQGGYTARPVKEAEDNAVQYLVVDNGTEGGFAQVAAGALNANSYTVETEVDGVSTTEERTLIPFFILKFDTKVEGAGRDRSFDEDFDDAVVESAGVEEAQDDELDEFSI